MWLVLLVSVRVLILYFWCVGLVLVRLVFFWLVL